MKIRFRDGSTLGPSFAKFGVLRDDDGNAWHICRPRFRIEKGKYICDEGQLDTIDECFQRGWLAEIIEGDLSMYIPLRDESKRKMRVRPLFAWYDLWVGAFIDRQRQRVYIFPLPCLGLVVEWGDAS